MVLSLVYKLQKSSLKTIKKKISIAHSPDADDAFMFFALSEKIIESDNFEIEHKLSDIQTLNNESCELKHDIQAISFFAYPDVEDKYQLLSCGGSLGYGYGPIVVGKEKLNYNDLKNQIIAIPGEKTTAYLLLRLFLQDFKPAFIPFDEVLPNVVNGKYPFGLLIHEGQLSYLKYGLKKVFDLGQWWLGKTNLPLPLGGNVIKRTFSEEEKKEINLLIKKSIAYAISNEKKIIPYVSKYAKELENNYDLVEKFVSMYVNEFTLDYGTIGKLAIKKLYQIAHKEGHINRIPRLDFVEC